MTSAKQFSTGAAHLTQLCDSQTTASVDGSTSVGIWWWGFSTPYSADPTTPNGFPPVSVVRCSEPGPTRADALILVSTAACAVNHTMRRLIARYTRLAYNLRKLSYECGHPRSGHCMGAHAHAGSLKSIQSTQIVMRVWPRMQWALCANAFAGMMSCTMHKLLLPNNDQLHDVIGELDCLSNWLPER